MTTYYLIRNKKTGKFVKRSKGCGCTTNTYVNAADATLVRSPSAATMIVQLLDRHVPRNMRYLARRADRYTGDHEIVKVGVMVYPVGTQPFIDGVLNGKP